jgi:hypothetical protein
MDTFILFCVIDILPNSPLVNIWIALKATQMILRHLYNCFKALDIKFGLYPVSWLRMTLFYVLYPAEYMTIGFLMLAALPYAKAFSSSSEASGIALTILRKTPELVQKHFDLSFVYFFYMFLGVPHFCNTYIKLHRKRT